MLQSQGVEPRVRQLSLRAAWLSPGAPCIPPAGVITGSGFFSSDLGRSCIRVFSPVLALSFFFLVFLLVSPLIPRAESCTCLSATSVASGGAGVKLSNCGPLGLEAFGVTGRWLKRVFLTGAAGAVELSACRSVPAAGAAGSAPASSTLVAVALGSVSRGAWP